MERLFSKEGRSLKVSDEDIELCIKIKNKYSEKFMSMERRMSDRRDTARLLGVVELLLKEVIDAKIRDAETKGGN